MSWFSEITDTKNVESEVQKNSLFYSPSGVFNAVVKFAGIYKTPDSDSTGLYVSFELENGVTFDQYVNFKNKAGKSTRTNKDGKEVKGYGLEQVESWDMVVGFGKPQNKTITTTMWGKDKESFLMPDGIGKKIKVCVRQVEEAGEDGKTYNRNEAEMIATMDGKTSGELYYTEEDARHQSLDKWKAKIEKQPILVRKPKADKPSPVQSSVSREGNPWA